MSERSSSLVWFTSSFERVGRSSRAVAVAVAEAARKRKVAVARVATVATAAEARNRAIAVAGVPNDGERRIVGRGGESNLNRAAKMFFCRAID